MHRRSKPATEVAGSQAWGLALPSIVWYIAFFVILPIVFIVLYSFGAKNALSTSGVPVDMTSLSFDNYDAAFSDTFFKTFRATIRIAVVATVLCTVIGLPVAYFLAFKVQEKWRAVLLALIIVPSFTSFLIRTLAWRIPLAPNGTLSEWLQDWGLRSTDRSRSSRHRRRCSWRSSTTTSAS